MGHPASNAYIERQRQTYRLRAVPLDQNQKTTIQPFFPEPTLDSARIVVLARERVSNPPFYGELIRMGFEAGSLPDSAEMAAITFVDTVVSHGSYDNRTLFHELVHAVQYEKLGLAEFAAKYVKGFLSGGSYAVARLERVLDRRNVTWFASRVRRESGRKHRTWI